jgi:hypothetical protein
LEAREAHISLGEIETVPESSLGEWPINTITRVLNHDNACGERISPLAVWESAFSR